MSLANLSQKLDERNEDVLSESGCFYASPHPEVFTHSRRPTVDNLPINTGRQTRTGDSASGALAWVIEDPGAHEVIVVTRSLRGDSLASRQVGDDVLKIASSQLAILNLGVQIGLGADQRSNMRTRRPSGLLSTWQAKGLAQDTRRYIPVSTLAQPML